MLPAQQTAAINYTLYSPPHPLPIPTPPPSLLSSPVDYPPPSSYLEFLHNVLSDLPPPNYALLKFLIRHLHIVSRHHAQNKMNAINLAIVFGPNFFRCVCASMCTYVHMYMCVYIL